MPACCVRGLNETCTPLRFYTGPQNAADGAFKEKTFISSFVSVIYQHRALHFIVDSIKTAGIRIVWCGMLPLRKHTHSQKPGQGVSGVLMAYGYHQVWAQPWCMCHGSRAFCLFARGNLDKRTMAGKCLCFPLVVVSAPINSTASLHFAYLLFFVLFLFTFCQPDPVREGNNDGPFLFDRGQVSLLGGMMF